MKKLFIILLLFVSFVGNATNYYVKNSGNDSNTGLSDSQAWKTISKINSSSFNPGDTVFLECGSVWRETLTIPSSGSSSLYIVFTKYGNGNNPKLLGSEKALSFINRTGNIWASETSLSEPTRGNVFFLKNNTVTTGNPVTYSVDFSNMTKEYDWSWNNDTIYVWATTDPDTRYDYVEVCQRTNGVYLNQKEYIEFNGLSIFFDNESGIRDDYPTSGLSGFVLKNCEIAYNGREDGYGYGIHVCYSNMLMEYDTIHDCGRRGFSIYNYGTSDIRNITIRYCVFYNGYHTTGADIAAGSVGGNTGDINYITIRNNYIYEDTTTSGSSSAMFSLIAGVNDPGGLIDSVYIYNNIHKYIAGTGLYCRNAITHLFIMNNTYYKYNPLNTGSMYMLQLEDMVGNNPIIKNNIFYSDGNHSITTYTPCIFLSGTDYTDITSNYNLFYTEDVDSYFWERYGGAGGSILYKTSEWATYKTTTSLDMDSPSPQDPLLVNPPDSLQLQATSPAVHAGVNVGLSTDYDGNTWNDPPSIGAYEYVPEW